ncbi:hypothetical protein FWK45_02105 [Histophilus somni]|uniref:Portal protein n=1 Tax=Histophilus somni TaxID=731 RepID=A0AAX2S1N5_HISSO|nr:hypothetical protein [Histophilus somni]QEH09367.1 hypothetical protein FWK43_07700 [Histophilus somni]QEH11980.1 hypothetical protein FWK44_02105 [Histophilus somni]QEH25639.1 hypothetical protein FWK61_07695 [Histophilus somni]QEH26460.1 hypothetical protein FWK62_02120 [Histophilus somni]QEH50649.1 hypothetical protein FWK45_02105 [Histophilus somni]
MSEQLANAIESYGRTLQGILQEQIKQRQPIVQRWTKDMYQYRNQYESSIDTGKSKVFVGYTRAKTDAWSAQMTDMLFPSDDKNYGISPTPVPQIAHLAKQPDSQDPMQMQQINMAKELMQQAKERSEAMEKLIDDQLAECDYASEARLALHYAAVLGTGILRGPVVDTIDERIWSDDGMGNWSAQTKSKIVPKVRLVLPWDFVPDMTAPTLKDCQFVFERSYLTKKQLQNLLNNPYYLADTVQALIESEASETHTSSSDMDGYLDTLRTLSGLEKASNDKRYEVWTYHGGIPVSVLEQANQSLEEGYALELTEEQKSEKAEIDGVIVMTGNGKILSVNLNPLDTAEFPYSVYTCEPDVACVFGFGIPYLCRDAQEILNTAWRGMIDNGVLTIGSQIVVNSSVLSPVDKSWEIKPNKLWRTNDRASANASFEAQRAFGVFNFESRQQELANIIQLAKSFMDEESGLPMIAQGEQGQVTPTLGGMSMLMNAANAVRRRQVKEWDDQVTKPLIRRFYEYNMAMDDDPNIKGDMQVVARGTSALLVKETQTAQIIDIFQKFGNHPQLSYAFDWYDGAKTLMQSMSMGAKTMLLSREDYEQKLQQIEQANATQPQDPEILKSQMQMQLAQQKQQHEMQLEQMKLQHAMQIEQMKVAIKEKELEVKMMEIEMRQHQEQERISLDERINSVKVSSDMQRETSKQMLDMKKFQAEIALKQQPLANPTGNYGVE